MTRHSRGPSRLRSRAARFISAAATLGLLSAGLTSTLAQAVAPPTQHTAKALPERVRATGTPLLTETFTGATADDRFIAVGAACLIGAPISSLGPDGRPLGGCPVPEIGPVPPLDSAPHGYLRLTDSDNDQSGAVLFEQALPASAGLDVSFDQWQYGSTTPATPADGISFFLVNGDVSLTHPGAYGGSLGYAQKLPGNDPQLGFLPGVDRGYLGVGLDVLGNYFGDWEQRGNGCPVRSPAGTGFHIPAPGANMVTLRGPGNGLEGYCFLTATTNNFTTSGPWTSTLPGTLQGPLTYMPPTATPTEAEALLEPSRRRVNVHLTSGASPVLTVSVDFNDGTGSHQVLQTPAPQPVPSTYKFGFAGSTGSFTDVHLIRNVVIGTDVPLPELNLVKQVHQPLPGVITVGTPIPYDFVVTNSGNVPITNLAVNDPKVGPVSCPVSTLAPGETVTCTATYLVTAADAAAGAIDNTAVATGTTDSGPVTSPPSSEHVPVISPPGLQVVKEVGAAEPFHVGDTVPYTYVVSNTGGTEITNLALTDDHVTGITCDTTTLSPRGSPGDTTKCHGTYVITAADADAGQVTNHVVATGTSDGSTVTSPEAEATVTVVGPSSIALTKTASTPGPVHVGDTITYTYTVTNTGSTVLTNVGVTDDHVTPVNCPTATLNPGESTTCTSTYVVTNADLALGHITNTAEAFGTNPEAEQVVSPPAEVTVPVIGVAQLSLSKAADSAGPFHLGDTVSYTYTVTNTGTAAVHSLTVSDDHVSSVTCGTTTLNPGESTTCHGSYVVTAADVSAGHVTNTAHATGTDPEGVQVQSPPAEATVPVIGVAELSLIKTADSAGPFHLGETISYTYNVTNTGTATVHSINITDDHVTTITCDTTTLDPGQTATCHGTYVVTAADITAGHVTNTAHATGTDPEGQPVQSPDVEATVPTVGEPRLSLTKTADSPGPYHLGDTVNYTYTVTNTGTAVVNNVSVSDDHVSPVTCAANTLNPGQSTTCHGSYVITAADVSAGHVTNTAHAHGNGGPEGEPVQSPPAEETVTVIGEPALSVTKTADSTGPFHLGETVSYTYTVTNTGTATVTNLTVTDDHVTPVTCDTTTLAPNQTTTCHGTYVITAADVDAGHVTNTAHATGTGPGGEPIDSPPTEETVPVAGVVQLSLEKTANSAGPFHLGETVTYTYTVTNTGTATVTNLTVTDDHVTPVTCDTTTLAPNQTTTCHGTYVITAADVAAGHVTNTAVASGTTPEGGTEQSPPAEETVTTAGEGQLTLTKTADSAGPFHLGETVTYTYTVTNTGTAAVHNLNIIDDHVPSVTCATTTLNPGQSTTCHGSYVITAADVTAGHVTNVAHANGTDPEGRPVQSPEGSASVPVVGEAQLRLTKTADSAGPFHLGDTVTYTYTVTNTGTGEVTNLAITDDHVSSVTCAATTLAPGASTTCHGSYVITAADVQAGQVTNTAHATGTGPEGQPVQSPPSDETVPVAGVVQLSLAKRADSAGPFHLGDTVNYTYTVTNIGTATVTNLTVTDDRISPITCDTTTLAPGASTTCHGSYVITAADVTVGHVTNSAIASGTNPEGVTEQSPPAEETVPVAGVAQLSIVKTADSAGPFHLGDTVSYTYTVTNTGTAAVHNLTVSDDHVSSVTCAVTTLNPGESTTCHGTYVITAADVATGHVTNTAHANGTDPEGQPVQSPPGEATVPTVGEAQLSIDKRSDGTGPFHLGDTVTYTYTVTNTGTAPVTNLVVTDNRVPSITCAATTLAPGASTTCHGSYVITAADVTAGQVTNTAHATGTGPDGEPIDSPPAEETVPVAGVVQLSLAKRADSAGPFHLGDTVTYTYTVTNTGTAPVTNLVVTDDHVTTVTCDTTTLNPGQTATCHGSYVITAADVTAGHVTNTAHATGTNPEGVTEQSPPAEETVPVSGVAQLSIDKRSDGTGPFHLGDTVTYTYTVTNTGTAPVTNLTVTDNRVPSITCDTTTLNPGQTATCHGSYVITAADVTAGQVTNTAHATGTGPDGEPVDSPPAEETVPVAGVVQLSLAKRADSAGPFHLGDTVTYTYTVTNTGTAPVTNLTVTDDHVTTVTCDTTTLAPGASTTCHGSYVITAADVTAGHVTNTAIATGTNPEGVTEQSPPAEETVPVAGVAQLSIVKKADSAGPFNVGDTVSYTYTVTNTGTAPITNITITDNRVASVTCDATTLNPGQSTTCHGTYTVTEADAQAGHVTNTAHATGTGPDGEPVDSPPAEETVDVVPPTSSLSITKRADITENARPGDTITYTYTVTNTGSTVINNITVTDDHVTSVTCDATSLNPGQSTTCHGTYTVTEADAQAGHVTNTARANGTDPEGRPVESPPVELCITVVPSASSLTITKQADITENAHPGDTITYTYTVTNTGSTTVTELTVNDDRVQQVTCDVTTLDPGQSTTCHGTYTVTEEDAKAGHVTNTATASARDPQGQLVQSPPVELCVTVEACPPKDGWRGGGGKGCPSHSGHPGQHPVPPQGGGSGKLPEAGSTALAAGLAGGGLMTVGGLLLYRAKRRAADDRSMA
ncbi:DUF7507 domain-containing protein [Kitasatospora brasiliensis]|uniref:DUF7507 domain-containing protein n=1 Tax=Kitasatospora brasiliensis TaxID=3058040 RepID=UPI00293189E1|nr:hypothetical protein [Kitasatospora sp. K002]